MQRPAKAEGHSPLADARTRSIPLTIVAAVILFFLLSAGWVNTIPICLRAVSSASAEAFGSIGAFASRARPHRARRDYLDVLAHVEFQRPGLLDGGVGADLPNRIAQPSWPRAIDVQRARFVQR